MTAHIFLLFCKKRVCLKDRVYSQLICQAFCKSAQLTAGGTNAGAKLRPHCDVHPLGDKDFPEFLSAAKPIQFFYMPESINIIFLYMREYDLLFGEKFYDYTWHNGIAHSDLMGEIEVPAIFIHADEQYSEDGILLAASSNEQARKAVRFIGDCELIEISSNHNIPRFNSDVFMNAVNRLK